MKKADVKLDTIVNAKSDEELEKPFLGKVQKIYENSALLAIIHFEAIDATAVSDLNRKIVVNFKNMTVATKKQIKEIKGDIANDVKIEKMKQAKIDEAVENAEKSKK